MTPTTSPTPETAAPTRAQRLDRLPFTAPHRRLLVGSGIGWALDAMDVGLISFVMAALAKQWSITATQQSWIGSIGFVGMAIGASIGGLLADRFGRRNVFALTLLVYGLATGAAGFSTGLAMLIALRFLVGLGLGAELPVASTLVSEYSPASIRGRMVVILEAFWAVGWILAALIGYFIVPTSASGWRWALFLGVVPAAYAAFIRSNLPESVRFLESKGRTQEAEAAVRSFESAAGIAPVESPVVPARPAPPWTELWGPGLRGRTLALWVTWFGVNFSYYGAFIWIPSLLVAQGYSLTRSFAFTLIITVAQLPGYGAAAFLVEVWGRRATLAAFLVGSAASAVWFGQAGSEGAIIAAGCALSFFNLGAWGALYAATPEVYPTALRASGAGSAAAFGRIASIIAPLSVPWLKATGGAGLIFGVFGAAFLITALAALGLPEWRGRALVE